MKTVAVDDYERSLVNSWSRSTQGEQYAALARLQNAPHTQRLMQEAYDRRAAIEQGKDVPPLKLKRQRGYSIVPASRAVGEQEGRRSRIR
jgi:hypothetical protein